MQARSLIAVREFQTYTCFQNQSTKKGETMDFGASVTCLYFSPYKNSLCNKCDTRKSYKKVSKESKRESNPST
jgi:hypothetical protein